MRSKKTRKSGSDRRTNMKEILKTKSKLRPIALTEEREQQNEPVHNKHNVQVHV